ncbi:MAG TPA: 6-bladed beta-propeller [Longimicrobiales bacterium]|nr:6-bladed beta-propeller [Longimicrobiales bacterium]
MKRLLPLSLLVCSLAACATTGRFGRVSEELIVFPPPPDTTRVQFLFTISNERDLGGRSGGLASLVTEQDANVLFLERPFGVDYHEGRFFVCDTELPGFYVIDSGTRNLTARRPRGLGALETPVGCAVDVATGDLYVADVKRGQVVVFDSTGSYVDSFGEPEARPSDVFVEGDRLWVADLGPAKIRVYELTTRRLLRSFPEGGPGRPPLRQPTDVWVQGGLVYVTDFGEFHVKIYREDGTFVRILGSYGDSPGQFVRPKGLAVDREGRIYVTDAGFENVQIFDAEGRLLMSFGGPYTGLGNMYLPAKVRLVYEGIEPFRDYVDPRFELEYLILVTNQYGPDRLNVYGFVRPATGS